MSSPIPTRIASHTMITLAGVSKAHGQAVLFRDVTLQLVPGRRVALVGGNGAGKTTLLEIALGLQQPDDGEVTRAKDARLGYLPQDLTETVTGTVLEETLAGAHEVQAVAHRMHELEPRLAEDPAALDEYGHLQERFANLGGYALEADAHRVLHGLGFAPEDADRLVTEMSGGWRVRVALARLLLSRPDVLVLDEPTNHLDLDSIAWLEDTLAAYEGAILFVSHDRDFIDRVAERVVELAAGTATEYVAKPGGRWAPTTSSWPSARSGWSTCGAPVPPRTARSPRRRSSSPGSGPRRPRPRPSSPGSRRSRRSTGWRSPSTAR